MRIATSFLEQNIESLSKILTAASKFGILMGGSCVIGYSLRVGHFPQDLSVGDGILFLMAAACFGVIYVFFIASLVALGISISPITRLVVRLIIWGITFSRKRVVQQTYEFAPFEWTAILFALFAVSIIFVLGARDSAVYWRIPLLSVSLYFLYSVYRSSGNKLRRIEAIENSIVHTTEKENIAQLGNPENLRKTQIFSLSAILITPLILGGVSGQLLDAAMRAAHVRVENATIYVKEPYSSLIPKSAVVANKNVLVGYTEFNKVLVLFKGFGRTIVVSFKEGNITRRLEIPYEYLIVQDRKE